MGKRGKIKQRERRKLLRRAERKGNKEEMLGLKNASHNNDSTSREALKNLEQANK